ncbi:MAG: DUF2442 domain-containing protein [Rhodanobacteraceae bacterium]
MVSDVARRGARRARGLHWEKLDEDISISGLLNGLGDRTTRRPRAA